MSIRTGDDIIGDLQSDMFDDAQRDLVWELMGDLIGTVSNTVVREVDIESYRRIMNSITDYVVNIYGDA